MEIPTASLEHLFTQGDAVLFEWECDDAWSIRWVSRNVERLLGISDADLIGRGFTSFVHPEDLPKLAAAVGDSVSRGLDVCEHSDYRLVRPDGETIWVHDVAVIQRDEQGEVAGFVGYLRDITAQRAQSLALVQQHDQLAVVLEGTRLGLWDWNVQTDGVLFDERWAGLIGYRLEEIEHRLETWESRVHPDDLDACYAAIRAHMEGETEFYENVHRMRHKDGHWVYILDRGRVVERDAEGKPLRFSGTHTDITPQKTAEIEAQRANLAKSAFLARMSHEIRTPLNGLLGVLQLVEGTELDECQRRYIEVLGESGETLLALLNDILDLSKVEAGEMRLECAPFDVRALLRSIHDLYRERAITKGLEYGVEIDDSVPGTLRGDAHRVRQVLSNLVANSLKFTEVGRVTLAASARELGTGAIELVLDVRDTGIGIEAPDEIWEAFNQGDVSTSRKYGGTGLGLTICRQLSELMGGVIDVESTPGVGTVFSVRLPLEVVDERASSAPEEAGGSDEVPRLRVLVAEDNAVNQLVIRAVLDKFGQDVTVVEDGAAALEQCRQRDFDLVLMDLHMPVMDGFEACRSIRSQIADDRCPRLVALSADAFATGDRTVEDAGFDGAVTKPFKVVQIAEVLRRAARRDGQTG